MTISGTWKPFMGVRQMLFSGSTAATSMSLPLYCPEAAENTLTTGKLTAIVQEKSVCGKCTVHSCRLAVRSMAVTGRRLPYGAARKADNAFNHFAKAMAEGPSLRSEDRFIRSRHERSRRWNRYIPRIPSSGLTSTQTEIPIPIPIMFIAFAWYCERSRESEDAN